MSDIDLKHRCHDNLPADPLTLLTMVEVVLERSQHIIGFSPEAQVDNMASFFSQAGIVLSYPFLDRVGIFLQVSIGEVVLLCKEIRETLVDLTVENRLAL